VLLRNGRILKYRLTKTTKNPYELKTIVFTSVPFGADNITDEYIDDLNSTGAKKYLVDNESIVVCIDQFYWRTIHQGEVLALKEDEFLQEYIAPKKSIEKSSFFEAINSRGLEQLTQVFNAIVQEARTLLTGRTCRP
jgi:hypothetical protein